MSLDSQQETTASTTRSDTLKDGALHISNDDKNSNLNCDPVDRKQKGFKYGMMATSDDLQLNTADDQLGQERGNQEQKEIASDYTKIELHAKCNDLKIKTKISSLSDKEKTDILRNEKIKLTSTLQSKEEHLRKLQMVKMSRKKVIY